MSDYTEQIKKLQREAARLPYGPTQVSLLEEAVRIADLHNDVQQGYSTRLSLTQAAVFSGRSDLLLVGFAWLAATFDKHPGEFDEFQFLWRYKWVVGNVIWFPEISRAKIEELLSDFDRRCREAGRGEHAVATARRDCYVDLHDIPAAQQANSAMEKCRRDTLSDCPACVVGMDGDYYQLQEQWEEQVRAIKPLLEGRLKCNSQPHRSVSRALLSLLHLGRVEEARELQYRYVRHLRPNSHDCNSAAWQVAFLALIDERVAANKLFNHFMHEAFDSVMPLDRLRYLRAGIIMLECLIARGVSEPIVLPPHQLLPAAAANDRHEILPLRDWMQTASLKLASAYDARNGNDFETRTILTCPRVVAELEIT